MYENYLCKETIVWNSCLEVWNISFVWICVSLELWYGNHVFGSHVWNYLSKLG